MNRKYPCLLLIFLVLAPSTTFVKASKETTFVTVSTFHSKFLDGTWKFVNENGNVSGVITFGNQDLCKNIYKSCKWDWQHIKAFSGIFSGHPISGTYNWLFSPSDGPGFPDISDLTLLYNYHHVNLNVMGNLTILNLNHMEWSQIGPINDDSHAFVVDGDYRLATGLHLHSPFDIIYLTRMVN